MTGLGRRYREWTDDEDQEMYRLRASGLSWSQVAEALGRSSTSCSTHHHDRSNTEPGYAERRAERASRLNREARLAQKEKHEESRGRAWTREEDEALRGMWCEGATYVEISDALDRTYSSVAMRLNKMRSGVEITYFGHKQYEYTDASIAGPQRTQRSKAKCPLCNMELPLCKKDGELCDDCE